jgi:4-amino-4-deoxy-L-arabinose transferase-like glycosyltransferase
MSESNHAEDAAPVSAFKSRGLLCGISFVLLAGLMLRLIHLDADPPFWLEKDFVSDEGWWVHNSRNKVLFNRWFLDDFNTFYSAPVFVGLEFVVMKLLGVDFWSIRLVPALSGWLTVLVFYGVLRQIMSPRGSLLAAAFLALNHVHVLYSRVAFVESTMLLFFMLTLYLWYLGRTRPLAFLFAGLGLGIMLATKVTSFYLLPIFFLLGALDRVRGQMKASAIKAICVGMLGILIPLGLLIVATGADDWWHVNFALGAEQLGQTFSIAGRVTALGTFLQNPVFGLSPVIFALSALAVYKLLPEMRGCEWRQMPNRLTDPQALALSIIIGNALPIFGLLHFNPRRFLVFLPAMAILAAEFLDRRRTWAGSQATPPPPVPGRPWILGIWLLYTYGVLVFSGPSGLVWIWTGLCFIVACLLWWLREHVQSVTSALMKSAGAAMILLPATLWVHLLSVSAQWTLGTGPGIPREIFALLFSPGLLCPFLLPASWKHRLSIVAMSPAWAVLLLAILNLTPAATWLLMPTYSFKTAAATLAQLTTRGQPVLNIPNIFVPTQVRNIVVRGHGINANPFERFHPIYIAHVSRDDWRQVPADLDLLFGDMVGPLVARIGLCPSPWNAAHYRFVVDIRRISAPIAHLQEFEGRAYEHFQLWGDAAEAYRRALARDPGNATLRTRLERLSVKAEGSPVNSLFAP